jgi:hypothetical protein
MSRAFRLSHGPQLFNSSSLLVTDCRRQHPTQEALGTLRQETTIRMAGAHFRGTPAGGPPVFVEFGLLEEELQSELNLSLISTDRGAGDYAEVALPQRGPWIGKIRLVEKVKKFGPEL